VRLSIAVLYFGGAVAALQALILILRKRSFGPLSYRILSLTVIGTFGSCVALSDVSAERLAPLYTLLGALSTYVWTKTPAPMPRSPAPSETDVD
jgi:hypothetical protein